MKNILILGILILFTIACETDDGNNNSDHSTITLDFTHNWDGIPFSGTDFGVMSYTNENGDLLSVEKLIYLISDISLHKNDGTVINIPDHHLIDLNNPATLTFTPSVLFPNVTYDAISFTFGLNETNNVSGIYEDLNSISWNWPQNLGGGYHFMQMDGKFQNGEANSPFAYHYGQARISENNFENNHFTVMTDGFALITKTNVEIKMNIAEWFKNPHTWDLHQFNTNLMGNYEAQIKMRENGASVFSLGDILR